MTLGERIYKLRTEKEMSQGDLADALKVSRQSISKWETNGSLPELDKLVKLSEVFGVSLDELILDQHVSAPPTPKKIWDSITLWNFQQQFLRKERKMMTVLSCPKCGILKQGVPEDLDEFAEEILDEM